MTSFIEMKSGKADEYSIRGKVEPKENNKVQMLLYQEMCIRDRLGNIANLFLDEWIHAKEAPDYLEMCIRDSHHTAHHCPRRTRRIKQRITGIEQISLYTSMVH